MEGYRVETAVQILEVQYWPQEPVSGMRKRKYACLSPVLASEILQPKQIPQETSSCRCYTLNSKIRKLDQHIMTLDQKINALLHTLFIIPNTENLKLKTISAHTKNLNGNIKLIIIHYPSFALPIPIWLGCLSVWNICNAS